MYHIARKNALPLVYSYFEILPAASFCNFPNSRASLVPRSGSFLFLPRCIQCQRGPNRIALSIRPTNLQRARCRSIARAYASRGFTSRGVVVYSNTHERPSFPAPPPAEFRIPFGEPRPVHRELVRVPWWEIHLPSRVDFLRSISPDGREVANYRKK